MIQQIYCTHCTYGTSALERREGELAQRVLGYSARAGSLERSELRNDYRAIERFLYYYLPSDTPPEEKQRLDAANAPRRLFFCPSMGKLQMVGQVAYRQYDTAGRLGSYFAHVLFGDTSSGPWSAADCLRLWAAPWVEEDSSEIDYHLPSLESIDALWSAACPHPGPLPKEEADWRPPIGDDAVLQFLQPPTGDGNQAVVTDRWRATPAVQRADLLVNTLQGLLGLGVQRRESVLLVVEPSVAALVFYAVVRLLPKSLSAGLSFSTYEPNAERLPVTLAATTFYDPFTADVRSDLYRRRGLVINTYLDRISESGTPSGDYARFIVEKLLADGWQTVDRLLAGFERAGAKRPEDLELLARTHPIASQVFSSMPPADDSWRKSEVAVRYLSQELQHDLATAPAGWPQLHKVIGTPNHLTVLELVASEKLPPEIQRPAQFLLKKFAPEKIADLVNSPLVARSAKVEALVSYIAAQNRLPDGCQLLGGNAARLKARGTTESSLLTDVLAKLPEPVLFRVYESVSDAERTAFFVALLDACHGPTPPLSVKKLLLEMIARFSDAVLLEALVKHREPIVKACPPPEPVLARRLERLLYELPMHPKHFEKWLGVLGDWKAWFSFPHLAERRLGEWNKFRNCLLELRQPDEAAVTRKIDRIKKRLRSPPRAEYKPLAEALARAMPRRTIEMDELAAVAAQGALSIPQFQRRLELTAHQAGLTLTIDEGSVPAPSGDELFGVPADEVARLHQRREQQTRMLEMFYDLQRRLLVYQDDMLGTAKLAALQQIGQVVVGRPDFLGQGRQLIEAYFSNNGAWTEVVLSSSGTTKHGFKYRTKRRRFTRYLVAVAVAAVVPLIGFLALRGWDSSATVATSSADPTSPPVPVRKPTGGGTTRPKEVKTSDPDAASLAKPALKSKVPKKAQSEPTDTSARQPSTKESASADDVGPSAASKEQRARADSADDDSVPPSDKSPVNNKPPRGESGVAGPKSDTPETPDPVSMPSTTNSRPDAVEATTATSAIVVQEFQSLPLHGSSFSSRIALKKWSNDPGSISLALKGLPPAGQRPIARFRLLAEPHSDGLLIAMQNTGQQDGAPNTLAKFTAADDELSFQWLERGQVLDSAEEARRQLRRCVLAIASAGNTGYIALAAPVQREPLGLRNGTAALGLRSWSNAEFQFQETDDLFLGAGYIELSSSGRLYFGAPDRVAKTAAIRDLPDDCALSGAQISLSIDDKNPLSAKLSLIEDAQALPDRLHPLADGEQKKLELLEKHLKKLKTSLGQARWWEKQDALAEIDLAIKTIGRSLQIADLPILGGKPPPDEPKQYEQEVKLSIVDPAEQIRDGLNQRQEAVESFHRQQKAQLKHLTSHALNVAAMIYRRVDANLYAPCLLLGDRDQLVPKRRSGSNFFFDDDEDGHE